MPGGPGAPAPQPAPDAKPKRQSQFVYYEAIFERRVIEQQVVRVAQLRDVEKPTAIAAVKQIAPRRLQASRWKQVDEGAWEIKRVAVAGDEESAE